MEESKRHEFDDKSPNKLKGTYGKAEDILVHVQWLALYNFTTVLNHCHLDKDCEHCYENKKTVVEESFENIQFTEFNLSSIDLVENLHEYENLEHECEVE